MAERIFVVPPVDRPLGYGGGPGRDFRRVERGAWMTIRCCSRSAQAPDLRNRVFSSSHEPAYSDDGMPTDRYRLYHVEKAKGGSA